MTIRIRLLAITLIAALLILIPLLGSAQRGSLIDLYINNPDAALRQIRREAAQLEQQVRQLEEQADATQQQYELHHQRAMRAVRFYDSVVADALWQVLFGSGDLVDLLSDLRLLERLAEQEAQQLITLRSQHDDLHQSLRELVVRQVSLQNRERLLLAFQEAYSQRQTLMTTYPDPLLRDIYLAAAWQEDAPVALRLLQHMQQSLRDGSRLFVPDGTPAENGREEGDAFVSSQQQLLAAILPLPGSLKATVQSLELFLLPDYAYWVMRHNGHTTILISQFQPSGRRYLRLNLEHALYRGVPLPDEQIQVANEASPLLIDIGKLPVQSATIRHEEGRIVLGP